MKTLLAVNISIALFIFTEYALSLDSSILTPGSPNLYNIFLDLEETEGPNLRWSLALGSTSKSL